MSKEDVISTERVIRDFIYVDVEKLYSLYSQVFEGVAEQIAESFIHQITDEHSQKGFAGLGRNVETQIAEVSLLTKNKFLYDHMYNKLEESLESVIWHSNKAYHIKGIKHGSLVKIRGTAEIEDYQHLNLFLENFNELTEAISKIVLSSQGLKPSSTQNRQNKAINPFLMGNHKLDQTMVEQLKVVLNMFNISGLEMIISPGASYQDTAFRGLLDEQWLRISRDYMRTLYGNKSNAEWVMVGQVTFVPDQSTKQQPQKDSKHNHSPSLKDAYSELFKKHGTMVRQIQSSQKRLELLVRPIAIYQETRFTSH